tara:strand:- start:14189 stop:14290 length:102 start_codon:yes stop_codon:yes gene_type:complete
MSEDCIAVLEAKLTDRKQRFAWREHDTKLAAKG